MTRPPVLPFLVEPAPAGAAAVRPLGAALDAIATPEVVSPWTPKIEAPPAPVAPPVAAPPPIDVEAIRAEARDAGRAEGLAETAALRARLGALAAALEAAAAAVIAPTHDQIADAVVEVIGAWTERADRGEVLGPAVRAWVTAGAGPATARVHPDEVAALREAIGEAAITVEADPGLARGDVKIRNAALELSLAWTARLRELRDHVLAALEGSAAP